VASLMLVAVLTVYSSSSLNVISCFHLLFFCCTLLHILFKNRSTSSWLLGCEILSIEVDDAKKVLLKQHYHELIEAKNKEIRESEKEQERLRKELNVVRALK
jgi:hypothetical protein